MQSVTISNRLLADLPETERLQILAIAAAVAFEPGHVFAEAGHTPPHVWFIEAGLATAHVVLSDGRMVGVMVFGPEGAINLAAPAAGRPSPVRVTAQTSGRALRVEQARLKALTGAGSALTELMLTYGATLQSDLHKAVACNAVHAAPRRLATWILRCHRRIEGDILPLKQEDFAGLLGAQRSTINAAAQSLQAAGAVSYSRGRVRVLNRETLARLACECAPR